MKMFTHYSKDTHEYLRACGNDVSRIDALIKSGSKPVFICSHYRADGGWKLGLSATVNPRPGEYIDEHAHWVNPNDFFEWFGGERIGGGL